MFHRASRWSLLRNLAKARRKLSRMANGPCQKAAPGSLHLGRKKNGEYCNLKRSGCRSARGIYSTIGRSKNTGEFCAL